MIVSPPSPGLLIAGKYRLLERIGGGGMGEVYRAEHIAASRDVAIKFLRPNLAEDDDLSQRFFQEAQAINRIRHPNIVEVIEAGSGEAGPYIVMEYLEGEPVSEALQRLTRFEAELAVATAIGVLEALDAAHQIGIVHRDLKPENIFLTRDVERGTCTIRLLDFGIAKVMHGAESGPSPRTRTGIVFGTPDYLSPEQATGELVIDGRSDLFTVGVLLFELLTGRRPFRASNAVATAFRVVHSEAPTLASTGVRVDPILEATVQRLLQKEPAKRFASAREVIAELTRLYPDPERRALALMRIGTSTQRRGSKTISRRTPSVAPRSLDNEPGQTTRPGGIAALTPGSSPLPRTPTRGSSQRLTPVELTPVGSGRISALRPVPSYPGQYQVRGPVLHGVERAIIQLCGRALRDQIVASLPAAYAEDFRNDSINALLSYDLEALDAYMELANDLILSRGSDWRLLGQEAVAELEPALRTALQPTETLASAVRRGIYVWSRLLTFGQWHVEPRSEGSVRLVIASFEAASSPLRQWLVGLIEKTLQRAADGDTVVTVVSGDAPYSPELACEIRHPWLT